MKDRYMIRIHHVFPILKSVAWRRVTAQPMLVPSASITPRAGRFSVRLPGTVQPQADLIAAPDTAIFDFAAKEGGAAMQHRNQAELALPF
jgi:hypothetical protein